MLIEFRVTNFRSFRDTQTISMVANTGTERLETNTFDSGISKIGRLVSSCAVYGPNAAGKTNLLRALQFMKSMVVGSANQNPVAQVSYTPFRFDILSHNSPSEFVVTFGDPDEQVYYEYGFSIDVERIHHEWLTEFRVKAVRIFERMYNSAIKDYDWTFGKALRGNRTVWRDSTRPNALFLSTAVQLNSTQLLPVFWWFQKRLVIVVGPTTFNLGLTLKLLDQPGGKERLLPFVREADPGIADVAITRESLKAGSIVFDQAAFPFVEQLPNEAPTVSKVTFSHTSRNSTEPIAIDIADESNGTQALFRTAGAWLNVFANGEVLLVDEIDTSLHSLLVRFLVERFHSTDTNPRNAQLLFTTHNTSLLSQDLLRRDQIWFVEKGSENQSRCYPLTDFSPRKDEAFERWYMRGKYGALPILSEIEL